MWLVVASIMTTKNTLCSKESGLHAHNMITVLSAILNMIGRTYMTINEHKSLHFHIG